VSARVGYVSMGPTPVVALLPDVLPSGPPADPASWAEAAAAAVVDLEPEATSTRPPSTGCTWRGC
jgi:hypothetical protein